jgi:hypothetical protein
MFWFSLTAACIALVEWPGSEPTVQYSERGHFGRLVGLLHRIDFGHAFAWQQSRDSELQLVSGERRFSGRDALARVALYHPTLYMVLYALAAIPQPQRRWAALVALGVAGYAALLLLRSRLSPRPQIEA